MVPLITREITFGQHEKLALGVNKFDLDLGVQIDSVKQPFYRNSVGSGPVSHCWNFCSLWLFWSESHSLSSKMFNWASHWNKFVFVTTWSTFDNSSTSRTFLLLSLVLGFGLPVLDVCVCLKNVTLLSPHPTDQEEFRPFANQHPKKWFPILWHCETLMFASCPPNLWQQVRLLKTHHRNL